MTELIDGFFANRLASPIPHNAYFALVQLSSWFFIDDQGEADSTIALRLRQHTRLFHDFPS